MVEEEFCNLACLPIQIAIIFLDSLEVVVAKGSTVFGVLSNELAVLKLEEMGH